jgi:hypothetical protein
VELVDELVVALIPDDDGSITERSAKAKKVEAVVRALEHEAMVAFFESFSYVLSLHPFRTGLICSSWLLCAPHTGSSCCTTSAWS